MLGWIFVEKLKHGKATSIGAGSGAIAGLVAITPACASLDPVWALLLGLVAGILCALAVDLKFSFGFDDSLDVVGIHLVGGIVGTLWIGIFGNGVGAAFGFGFDQLAKQAIGAGAVLVFSFVMALIIGFIVEKTIGFRVKAEDEIAGIDTVVHGEEAYAFGADRG
jgi:Amt family ammonium transporter